MKKLILHIGAGKCASSSIQSFLTQRFVTGEIAPSKANNVRYACYFQNGRVQMDSKCAKPWIDTYGYVASDLLPKDADAIADIFAKVKKTAGPNDTVVMSCEGWASQIYQADFSKAFVGLGCPVDIYYITRPPLDWLNSGWWQWGVWTGLKLGTWCTSRINNVKFCDIVEKWKNIPGVSSLEVIDIRQDPVTRFQVKIGEKPVDVKKKNQTTNLYLLKYLIKYKKELGRTENNPIIELKINSQIKLPKIHLPNIIPQKTGEIMIERADNKNIRELFNSNDEEIYKKYNKYTYKDLKDYVDLKILLKDNDADIILEHFLNERFLIKT